MEMSAERDEEPWEDFSWDLSPSRPVAFQWLVQDAVDLSALAEPADPLAHIKSLWRAVIAQALADVASSLVPLDLSSAPMRKVAARRKRAAAEAIEWLRSDEDEVGSLVWICDTIDAQVWRVRQQLDKVLAGE